MNYWFGTGVKTTNHSTLKAKKKKSWVGATTGKKLSSNREDNEGTKNPSVKVQEEEEAWERGSDNPHAGAGLVWTRRQRV